MHMRDRGVFAGVVMGIRRIGKVSNIGLRTQLRDGAQVQFLLVAHGEGGFDVRPKVPGGQRAEW